MDAPAAVCIIRDLTNSLAATAKPVRLPQSCTVQQLLDHIHKDFGYKQGSYKLLYEMPGSAVVSWQYKLDQ